MRVYAGTSGYSYKEWKGAFYPEKLASSKMLAYYAERLSTVEINNTFYRVPKENVVRAWADEVPEGFRFVLKATRRITHRRRLKDAAKETEYMLGQFAAMSERLGAVLFQLPPSMKCDVPRLSGFLELLPDGTRAAFEFRHPTWFDQETYACLRSRNFALVISDSDPGEGEEAAASDEPLVTTADWTYLRLRREAYTDAELEAWADRLHGAEVNEAFAFFKHEDDGTGPRAAARFLEVSGS